MARIAQQLETLIAARIKELDILIDRKQTERAELNRTLTAVKPVQNGNLRKGMPEAAKRKIAIAQRKRWALFRKAKGGKVHANHRRTNVARMQLRAA